MTDTSSPLTPANLADAACSAGLPGAHGARSPAWANCITAARETPTLRILVVEDDALIQMLMCETLISLGHEVCAVAAAELEAVEAASRSCPDLMIVDAHLETGSGLAAVRQILLNRPIPYIFVSGDTLAAELLDPGAVTLEKPYQERDLTCAIARAMAPCAG